ncbi:pyruvate dehydrogenase complex dihydrolipoamide acetyltransferase [Ostertagia ostertagi]
MSTIPARGFRFRTIGGLRYGAAAAVSPASLGVVPQSRPASTSHLASLICNSLKNDFRPTAIVRGTRPFCSGNLPPHKRIALPALSPTMENGNIVSWQKKEGDQLGEGDLLCEIETDKATMGFETPEEGYLAKICIPEGTKGVPIGKLLCIIVESEGDVAAFKDFKDDGAGAPAAAAAAPAAPAAAEAPSAPAAEAGAPPGDYPQCNYIALPALSPTMETGRIVSWQKLLCIIVDNKDKVAAFKDFKDTGETVKPPPPAAAPSAPPPAAAPPPPAAAPAPVAAAAPPPAAPHPGGHVSATPLARKLAAERGVDISGVAGSGPGGRILAADLARAPAGAAAPAAAPRPGVPSGPVADYIDIPLTGMRSTIAKRLTERTGGSTKISINDFIVKASALACLRVPEVNSFWMDSFIRQNNTVDVSVAVSTPSGLITPIVFQRTCEGIQYPPFQGLATISAEVTELAARARDGKLQPNEFQGGTFTVSNLGMFGSVTDFTAIINPPQSCILAIGGAETKLVPCEEEGYRSTKVMKVTLSCDHRVVDGAVGAVWLRHFKEFLEKPHTMLL